MAVPRSVRLSEIEELAEMVGGIFGIDKLYSKEQMVAALRRPRDRKDALVIAEGGKLVSQIRTVYERVSVFGCEFKVASIGTVCTKEEHRGRGYAGAILNMALKQMRERGVKALIVSGNRSLYRRNHCVPAGRLYEASVGRDFRAPAEGPTARKVTPNDWAALAPLHQAEGVRFVRSADFVSRLPFWWDCERPDIWLIEHKGEPVAYALLSLAWRQDPERKVREIHEYAGSRAALVEALPGIIAASGLHEVKVLALGHDRELVWQLEQRGLRPRQRTLGGTHRIIDLPGLMQALRPYLAERLPREELRELAFEQRGEKCAVSLGREKLRMTLSEAAPLVLGGPGAPKAKGELGRVLGAVFPVPFPMPGFNYV
ncbi:MAG: GNAT family N-acetyltransferase [Armatimonadota bacterium]